MKKTLKFIGLFAMAAVLFSCEKKVDPTVDTPKDPEQQGVDLSKYNPDEYLVSFGATIEAPQTKATITIGNTEASVEFDDNDKVLVVSGGSSATYVYNKGGATDNKFYPESEPLQYTEGDILFYYPASCFSTEGVFTMPLAAADLADLGDKAPMAAKSAAGETVNVTFKNVASILQVSITGNRTLSSVRLSANEFIGDGTTFEVSWSGDTPSMASGEGSAKSISVSSSVTLSDTPAIFYFIVPAGIDLTGVNVTAFLTTQDNGSKTLFNIDRGNWNATPGNIYKMSFYAGLFSGGTGTSEDPYIIKNARDFKHINTYITNGYGSLLASHFLGAYYKQTADIDFKNVQMAPIGDSDNQFTGEYDGNGKQLQNVKINETGQFAGIFAYVNGSASIKDLTVSGSIKKTGSTDNSCVGGIAGIVRGAATVTGCTNNATITSSATYTGGLAGRLYQSTSSTAISGCTNNGSVTSSVSYTGGIVGQQIHGGTIVECVNKGTVSGTSYVGGIVGDMGAASAVPSAISFISFCRNDATINASANCSGGIAGRIINGSVVSSCFAKGTVSSESYDVGGIAGVVQVNNVNANSRVCVYDCLTAMNVTTTRSGASNEARTGGAVGFVSNNQAQYIAIDNCGVIATSVTVGGGTKVGGFVGRFASSNTNKNRTRIRNCYTLVSSISSPNSLYGGFVGNAESYGELHYCYYVADDTNVTIHKNTTQDNLTKKTAAEIASNATCGTFNANNYVLTIGSNNYGSSLGWNIPAGCDYPVPGSLSGKGEDYFK